MKKYLYLLTFATLLVGCGDDEKNGSEFTKECLIEYAEQFDKGFEAYSWNEVDDEGTLTEEYNDWYHHSDNEMTEDDVRKILNDWAETDSQKCIAKWLSGTSLSRHDDLFDECRNDYIVAKLKEQDTSAEKEAMKKFDQILECIKAGNAMDAIAIRNELKVFASYLYRPFNLQTVATAWAGVDPLKKEIADDDIKYSGWDKRYPLLAQYWNDLPKYRKAIKNNDDDDLVWVD